MIWDKSRLQRLTGFGVVMALLLAPTQYGLRLGKELYLSPVDPLIWGLFFLWVVGVVRNPDRQPIPRPPLFTVVFILIAAVSVPGACQPTTALKEMVQLLEYLVLAYVIFLDHLPDPKIRHRMVFGFLIVSTVILLVGLTQYHTRSVSPSDGFLVRGTFGNRNVFGGFLCLVLPLMFGFALWSQQLWQRIWFLTALLAGASLVLSGGAAVALGLSLLVVALLRGQRTALLFVVGVLLIIPLLSRLPRENLSVAWKSVALYNDEGEVHSRYTEWQAAAEMIRDHPWRGVGIGNYQANIGRYYGILPRPPSKAEPDSQNLYLVIASTTGIPGLLSFLALLGTFAVRAVHAFHLTDEPWKKGAAAGLVGSLLGFAINSIWSPLLVRGMGIPIVWMFAFCSFLASGPDTPNPQNMACPRDKV